jgi:hypothetical protein
MWNSFIQFAQTWWWMPILWVATFLGGLLLMRWLILRIPADYFVRPPRDWRQAPPRQRLWHGAIFLAKNSGGLVLLAAGLVMIFTPGPGLLAIALGLSLMNFPGKRRLEERLLCHPSVLHAANRLRQRNAIAPLREPRDCPSRQQAVGT